MSHAIPLIIVLNLLFFKPAISGDTLFSNQTLRDGDTIVSANETFELGFFASPPNSTNLYLGIWYKKIPDRVVVWVANRDDPVTDSPAFLRISNSGDLILTDQSAKTIWSSSNPQTPRTEVAAIAKLFDSGNFAIITNDTKPSNESTQNTTDDDEADQFLWQSFDYPTDTLLPGMKLGVDSGLSRILTSWKSPSEPSTGAYSFRVHVNGFPEIMLRRGLTTLYRSGPWNGFGFSGVPEMKPNHIFNFTFVIVNEKQTFYTFTLLNESIYSRLVVNSTGVLQRFTWFETSKTWNLFWYSPKDQCDSYRECGAYGVCNTNLSPVCECVEGFEPRDEENWSLRDGSDGCKLGRGFGCGEGEFGFLKMSGMKLPETSTSFVNMSMSVEDCEEKCRSNCSCFGYALGDLKSGVGCVMWFGDLVDLRQYAEGGQDLFVRVSSSVLENGGDSSHNKNGGDSSHNKKPIALIVTLIVVPTFVVLLGCCLFFTWKKKLKNNHNRRAEERGKKERSQDLIFDKVLSSGPRDHHSHEQNSNEDFELPLIDLSTLAIATSNFNQGNKLGQGGFGSVFKGTLADGKEVAVKRLSKNSGQGGEEFKNEVLLIAKLQHRNLVRLLACCIEGDEKILVYEYMQNKSLDCVIFNKVNSSSLDWRKRLNIIVGIARGLLYLHQDSRFRIIHRDLKASNVLLDGEMNPKISDFGMARIFGGDETEVNTKRVVGTYGYMSPEYAMDGIFSIKSDVFSFGVLVLEIVSGKKNRGFYQSSSEHNLLGHAWRLWKEGKALELIDPSMADSCLKYEVLRCIQVGLLCVQERAEERPTMSTVVLMLSSESVAIAQPKQPGFCLVSTPFETESSSSKQDSCTVNHVTVTMLDAR